MKRVMYTQIKHFESGTPELYVKLKKKKKIPSSRIRTSDLRISTHLLQSPALPTELSKEGVCIYDFSG